MGHNVTLISKPPGPEEAATLQLETAVVIVGTRLTE